MPTTENTNSHRPRTSNSTDRPQSSQSPTTTTAATSLPPVIGPDGRPLQGNALTNAIRGGIRVETANGGERTSRACLACRKLKSRCDGAEDPPCKRCRTSGQDCVFVESKRGKRPVKVKKESTAAPEDSLVDKFRRVEKDLSTVLDSIGSGEQPDPNLVSQLQASLADGNNTTTTTTTSTSRRRSPSRNTFDNNNNNTNDGDSPASSNETLGTETVSSRGTKRARYASISGSSGVFDSPQGGMSLALSPSAPLPPSSAPSLSVPLPSLINTTNITSPVPPPPRQLSSTPSQHASPSHPSPSGTNGSLSMLADASLAAQIDGRSRLTGLDPSFKLSTVTNAIQHNKKMDEFGAFGMEDMGGDMRGNGVTPAVLSKGIVTPEMAVELFTIFFDFAYIHLPLLDPARHTAPWVCQKSTFLFTVILAVASRFHSDPTLHNKIYEEAHQCFVDCLSEGERTVEAVQACCILTVWTYPPKGEGDEAGREERPKRAWLYFGMAVRLGLELNLFRPPSWVDYHVSKPGNSTRSNPWINLPRSGPEAVGEDDVWQALNQERTWLMVFVIDRNMSAVMGRPYQIHEAKPLLLPLHPSCLPFDLGVIAHVELQTIIGQVMDTFRDRLYGLSSASDEMPSAVVMKLFNSRMDEWKMRWCPMPGEPIANNLLFYFYSSKLFLNTIPLHTMLRNGDVSDDPDSVSSTICAAKSLLDLGHAYAELSVLRHCPDVNFLLMLYAAVFLVKVRVSNSRFSQLVDSDELEQLLLTVMRDCQVAAQGDLRHSAMTCLLMTRALGASWKALETGVRSRAPSLKGVDNDDEFSRMHIHQQHTSPHIQQHHQHLNPEESHQHVHAAQSLHHLRSPPIGLYQPGSALDGTLTDQPPPVSLAGPLPNSPAPLYSSNYYSHSSSSTNPFTNPFAASSTTHTPLPMYRNGIISGPGTPSVYAAGGVNSQTNGFPGFNTNSNTESGGGGVAMSGGGGGTGGNGGSQPGGSLYQEGVDNFLSDSHFFNSLLVGRGASGFFDWQDTTLPSLEAFDPNLMNDPNWNFSFDPLVQPSTGATATTASTSNSTTTSPNNNKVSPGSITTSPNPSK